MATVLPTCRYHQGAVYDYHLDTPNGMMEDSPNRTVSVVLYCSRPTDFEQPNHPKGPGGALVFPVASMGRGGIDNFTTIIETMFSRGGFDWPLPAGAPFSFIQPGVREVCDNDSTNGTTIRYAKNGHNVFVPAKPGSAAMFYSHKPHGQIDLGSIHASCPSFHDKWIRATAYRMCTGSCVCIAQCRQRLDIYSSAVGRCCTRPDGGVP